MNNQNQLSGLDPKLQEKFHQVMNTPLPNSTPAAPVMPAAPVQNQPLKPLWTPPADLTAPTAPQPIMPQTPSVSMPSQTVNPMTQMSSQPTVPAMPQSQTSPANAPVQNLNENVVNIPTPVSSTNSQVFSNKKKVGKISPVIVVFGVVAFLLVYTFVWIKIFGLSLPFLP